MKRSARALGITLIALALTFAAAYAAATSLAQAPLAFLQVSPVKPNILFILDDSGSMQWTHLGDEVLVQQYENRVGYRSSLCNKIYYDPAVRYPVPVDADGKPYPDARFNAARYDGFRTDSPLIDLGRDFMAWRSLSSVPATPAGFTPDCWRALAQCSPEPTGLPLRPEAAHYFVYRGSAAAVPGDNGADDPCKDTRYADSESGIDSERRWLRVIVGLRSGPGDSDERQNFANWFSYHRTRMLTMKTAMGRAFSQLDDSFRVGLSVISDTGIGAAAPGSVRIDDFSSEHRRRFYNTLYGIVPLGSTPLRAALSRAGRLYAGRLLTGSDDPVRYSCQRNYTILSTDSYWNANAESGSFGPKQIDGSTNVGNADRNLPRPMGSIAGTGEPRVATLTVMPDQRIQPGYVAGAANISVNGQELMNGMSYIEFKAGMDPGTYVRSLATGIGNRIQRGGYRAFVEENRIYILAPASAGDLRQLPEVMVAPQVSPDSKAILSVTPFSPVADTQPHANTLADVAAYYFETDLRSPALANCGAAGTLCEDNVPIVPGQRGGHHQHMVTHTLGLGANGTLSYREDYETAAEGDFHRIVNGKLDWPDPIFAAGPERIDDLWHAAVNGGGRYFNARNPESLARALGAAVAAIRASTAAAAAAATGSEEPAEGNNLLFSSRYRTQYWDGELEARRLNLEDGSLAPAREWSAAARLASRTSATADKRRILLPGNAAETGLKEFRWELLDADEQALFDQRCAGQPDNRFSHCAQLSADQQALAGGSRLVDYLRGRSGHEDRPDNPQRLFRKRDQALGAPVNAQPLFVGTPAFRYADDNYGEFRDHIAANRAGTVYLAANDGMLHAFDSATGDERWAFIPTGVLPHLWRHADPALASRFRYLLDGTPVAGDICPLAPTQPCAGADWRTLLVGGLGAAGREYYALDVTDPDKPRYLWRFSVEQDSDLGYAVGKPLITKRRDGTWVVVLASGYDNVNPGSGRGVLFVLNAATGTLLARINTGEGSASAPAGLAQLNAWIDNLLDNTAERLYGGDLHGRLWRFDIHDQPAGGSPAVLLAHLKRDGRAQPITTRPALSMARVGGTAIALVSVGTGSLLAASDLQDRSVQSLYTLRDPLTSTGLGDVRSSASMVRQQLAEGSGAAQRKILRQPVDWSSATGWYVDFDARPGSGERVNLDLIHQLGVLRVVTNQPDDTPCRPGAEAWAYAFDYLDGSYLPTAGDGVVGRRVSRAAMVAGIRQLRIGKQTVLLLTDESGNVSSHAEAQGSGGTRPARRISWRELDRQ